MVKLGFSSVVSARYGHTPQFAHTHTDTHTHTQNNFLVHYNHSSCMTAHCEHLFCLFTYTYMCTHIHIHIHIHIHPHAHTHIHTCMHTHACTHNYSLYIHNCTHVYTQDATFSEPLRKLTDVEVKAMGLKYYNPGIHHASFVLPQFAKEVLSLIQ